MTKYTGNKNSDISIFSNNKSRMNNNNSQLFQKSFESIRSAKSNKSNNSNNSKSSNRNNNEYIKGIRFDKYSPRDLSLKSFTRGSPFVSYIDPSKNNLQSVRTTNFSQMSKRKELFQLNKNPSALDYNPKYTLMNGNRNGKLYYYNIN
jgi:hypothetical protein